jgi:hypothetical protein
MKSGVAAIKGGFARFVRALESYAAIGVAEMRVRRRSLESVADGVVVGDGELRRLMAFHQQDREIGLSRDGRLQTLPFLERRQFLVLEFGTLGCGCLFHAESGSGCGCSRCVVGGES